MSNNIATNPYTSLTEKKNPEPLSAPAKTKWHKKWWGILIILLGSLILILFLIFVGLTAYYYYQIKSGKMPLPSSAKFQKSAAAAAAPKQIDLTKIAPTGEPATSPAAAITVAGFFDFQCPFSKEASANVRELQTIYGDKINFVFRNFPLAEIHPEAMLAAQAGECAQAQNKFWQMHDKLFTSQDLSEQNLRLYAAQIGLDETAFSLCLNAGQSKGNVLKDVLDGYALGVAGTPTWFINGAKIEGAIPVETFKKMIDFLLAQ